MEERKSEINLTTIQKTIEAFIEVHNSKGIRALSLSRDEIIKFLGSDEGIAPPDVVEKVRERIMSYIEKNFSLNAGGRCFPGSLQIDYHRNALMEYVTSAFFA